jgi:hypothetical protein
LCRAYSAGQKATHGKALESSAFSALIKAAGGKDKVAAYCARTVANERADKPGNQPEGAQKRSDANPKPEPSPQRGRG